MATPRQRMKGKQRRQSIGEQAVDAIKNVERKVEHALTCMDNHYILSGYRPATESFKKSFASLSYLHNESVNIYTHLLGALLFLFFLIYLHSIVRPRYAHATPSDILAFTTFFLSATTCLGMSATYHTISNHSPSVAKFGNQLDYLGIIVLIVGSSLPTIYYGFLCHATLIWTYWGMMCIFGSACAVVTFNPVFRTPKYRPFRAAMFVALGGAGVVPVLHGLYLFGAAALKERVGLSWVLLEAALYVTGATIYAARVPEKFWPGRFDLVGASHQMFHSFVVAAALMHLKGLMVAFDGVHSRGGQC
ncbi:hemolysin-III related-domain-containing protein [Sphaerosporella brunnea]|uniref:Hemolysin-III related-domain-containing protein n=1 Tax=Sphaerosporella brunnea TaxID=1250544 RepID=A0A5J5FAT6_9PEZI|nr:hemolysin-III related-domain-containing protein [Sphaerosporella brunnea]